MSHLPSRATGKGGKKKPPPSGRDGCGHVKMWGCWTTTHTHTPPWWEFGVHECKGIWRVCRGGARPTNESTKKQQYRLLKLPTSPCKTKMAVYNGWLPFFFSPRTFCSHSFFLLSISPTHGIIALDQYGRNKESFQILGNRVSIGKSTNTMLNPVERLGRNPVGGSTKYRASIERESYGSSFSFIIIKNESLGVFCCATVLRYESIDQSETASRSGCFMI